MLKNIQLKNVASYNDIGTSFTNFKIINFIYGNNGSGKSTFSNYFNNLNNNEYVDCYYKGEVEETRFIYNKKFLQENFKSDLPGIFTLGKDYVDREDEIDLLYEKISGCKDKYDRAKNNYIDTIQEIEQLRNNLREYIWAKKNSKDPILHKIYNIAFKGLHGSKERFLEEFLRSIKLYNEDIENVEELNSKYEILFDENKKELPLTTSIIAESNIDVHIFETPIISGKVLELEELTRKLDIHKWLHDGTEVINQNNLDNCPLCGQSIGEEIKKKLNNFFNENYYEKIEFLEKTIKSYEEFYKECINYIESIMEKYNHFIVDNELKEIEFSIKSKHTKNEKEIATKRRSPSNIVSLDLFSDELSNLNTLRAIIDEQVIEHNRLVRERINEQNKWIKSVWNNFFEETKSEYQQYIRKEKDLSKRKNGLERTIDNSNDQIKTYELQIKKLKDEMYGIESTVDAINSQLKMYGFNNFLLSKAKANKYKIIREDGRLANETLSEGEKTFITFLYYYHLVKTNEEQKMVIIDDPISSLDSTILHIVSSLVTDLIENKDLYKIKQIFISTHNTYFYKEITYKINNCSYYILRKDNIKGSFVTHYETNPITNSYEALWKELFELKDSSSSLIQNIMRRILENYFKFLGGIELEKLLVNFNEDERIIAQSLIKWVHDGSHNIAEDLYVQEQEENNKKYFSVFREIFIKNNHNQHFKMMIENCKVDNIDEIFQLEDIQACSNEIVAQ